MGLRTVCMQFLSPNIDRELQKIAESHPKSLDFLWSPSKTWPKSQHRYQPLEYSPSTIPVGVAWVNNVGSVVIHAGFGWISPILPQSQFSGAESGPYCRCKHSVTVIKDQIMAVSVVLSSYPFYGLRSRIHIVLPGGSSPKLNPSLRPQCAMRRPVEETTAYLKYIQPPISVHCQFPSPAGEPTPEIESEGMFVGGAPS